MPGLAVDRFEHIVVIHAESPRLVDRWREPLEEHLADFSSAYVKIHPRQTTRLSAEERDSLASPQPLWGLAVEEIDVVEGNVHYLVKPAAGLSVGLFLDMREVRGWLRQISRGRSVLNTFAYTCSLGLSAMLGGAARVLNLDISRQALAWGRANYGLNDLPVDPHDFIFGEAFDWLGRFARREQRFDLVILDPPSFSSMPFSVERDYPRLVAAAARVLSPTGILLAATNHASTSEERFEAWLHEGLIQSGRHARLLHSWREPATDFPLPPDRRPYLKVRALEFD